MRTSPNELLLPLADATSGELTTRRWEHLTAVAGVDARSAERLARAFPTLGAIYRASEEDLVRAVGPVVASRLRWFLDAPIDTGPVSGTTRHAA
ncbi:MAG: hypothetical protein ACYDAC_02845 [Candidatus Dormibacteria bacterium]